MEPKGLKYKPSLALFGSFSCKYFSGDGIFNKIKQQGDSSKIIKGLSTAEKVSYEDVSQRKKDTKNYTQGLIAVSRPTRNG